MSYVFLAALTALARCLAVPLEARCSLCLDLLVRHALELHLATTTACGHVPWRQNTLWVSDGPGP